MKKMCTVVVVISAQCLYAMEELSTGCMHAYAPVNSFQSRDQSYVQKIADANDLKTLLYLKSVAEKNEYIEAIERVNDKLSRFSDIEELCRYIASYCDLPNDPKTLNEVSYRQHNVEIVTALSLLRNLLPQIDQHTRIAAMCYYNAICRTIKSWSYSH